jgi:hypothetical protein
MRNMYPCLAEKLSLPAVTSYTTEATRTDQSLAHARERRKTITQRMRHANLTEN